MKWVTTMLLLVLLSPRYAPAETVLFAEHFSHGIPACWENVAFFKKLTDYSAVRDGTNCYLRGVADKGCSALSTKLSISPPARLMFRWRWKIDGVNTNGSERELAKFDHAARVFIAFDTFLGPPLTLNYLWGDEEKPGTILDHPKSGRAKIFVLESGNDKAGCWITEERDITADWHRAFGEKTMPKIVGLGVMTDGDSLGMTLSGDYADIELIGE